jgi:hypothetical protein
MSLLENTPSPKRLFHHYFQDKAWHSPPHLV